MKKLRPLLSLLVATLLLPTLALAKEDGGSSSNGGGAGLVRVVNGKWEVITVDRWESQFRKELEPMLTGETPVNYIRRILDTKVRPINAFFVLRLEEALSQVLATQWTDVPNLSVIHDFGRIKGNYKKEGWQLVQLVIRSSESVDGHRPKVAIQFNKNLFSYLGNFDIALLLLHEAVYVLGTELDQRDSYNVRKLVTRLLEKDTMRIVDDHGQLTDRRELTKAFNSELRGLGFGNFAHLFKEELKKAVHNNTANQKQRAYQEFLNKNPFPFLTRFWDFPGWINDQQAFMLYWYLFGGPGELWNKSFQGRIISLEEYVASPNPEMDQVKRVCDSMKLAVHPKLKSLDQSKAENYCRTAIPNF